MAADKPVVQFTIASIRKDVKKVDVLKVGLSGSKTITFPDLMAAESEEAELKLARIDACGDRTWEGLDLWLSEADAALLRAEKLSRAELIRLLKNASQYYKDAYGDLGNDTASERF
ncbi:hypothetical protein [Glutamicibacter protophormiae]|uniref:hypothetical protein n=1 Tax=Glutamicibacter protophormiae TaxID=37930 RepID=UPI003A8F2471